MVPTGPRGWRACVTDCVGMVRRTQRSAVAQGRLVALPLRRLPSSPSVPLDRLISLRDERCKYSGGRRREQISNEQDAWEAGFLRALSEVIKVSLAQQHVQMGDMVLLHNRS